MELSSLLSGGGMIHGAQPSNFSHRAGELLIEANTLSLAQDVGIEATLGQDRHWAWKALMSAAMLCCHQKSFVVSF